MVRAIGDSPDSISTRHQRLFTPSEATAMLPLVRRIAADLVALGESIGTQRRQIREIDRMTDTIQRADYSDELSDIRSSLADDEAAYRTCLAELSALGVVPHEPVTGGVDFPAVMNRRAVQLCWMPGEMDVRFWHESGEACSQRRPIETSALLEKGSANEV